MLIVSSAETIGFKLYLEKLVRLGSKEDSWRSALAAEESPDSVAGFRN